MHDGSEKNENYETKHNSKKELHLNVEIPSKKSCKVK